MRRCGYEWRSAVSRQVSAACRTLVAYHVSHAWFDPKSAVIWKKLKERRRSCNMGNNCLSGKRRSQVRDIHGNTRTVLETVAGKAIDKWRIKNRMLKQFDEKDKQIF